MVSSIPCSETWEIHGREWLYSRLPLWIDAWRPYGSAAASVSKSSSHTGLGDGSGDFADSLTPRPLHLLKDHSFAMLHHTFEYDARRATAYLR